MNDFKNKKILVTGGTGSLGKELVWHLLKYEQPDAIRIYDVDETEQFNFQTELRAYFKDDLKKFDDTMRFLLGDVRDKDRLNRAVEDIDIIFHTAALKHVMACEYNPFEAVKTYSL
jgi:UDP-N-acetylglucosamine 4,6-dehydratase